MPEFRIQRCLGRGGFGEVYKAVMTRGNGVEMDVAIKVLRSDLDPASQGIQRLRDEGRLLGRMTHPSILRVYDLVVIEGHAALVSEYVAGDDLSRLLKEAPIPPRVGFEVVAQVAAALDAAWSHPSLTDGKPLQLVHRDVKPDNIRIDPFGAVKLLDFGIAQAARVQREAHTSVNTIMGSTQYLSPERLVEQETGPEGDVFALGCTAFEILTGEALFVRKSMRQMYLLMVDEGRFSSFVAERCASHLARLGPHGVALVTDTTAYDRARRPTASEVALRCDTLADGLSGPTLRAWCRSRTWSPPPEMSGPLEGQCFVIQTGAVSTGPLPPTATARHKLASFREEAAAESTDELAPTQAHRAAGPPPPARSPLDEPTLEDLTRTTGPLTVTMRSAAPGPDPGTAPAPAAPPALGPSTGPSPWTPEERLALASGSLSLPLELPPPPPPGRDTTALRRREPEPSVDSDASTPLAETSRPGAVALTEVPDLPEPPGTHRLPVLERQRSPALCPAPTATLAVPPPEGESAPDAPATGEVAVRDEVPVRAAPRPASAVAPPATARSAPVDPLFSETLLVQALSESTVRVLAAVPAGEEDTQRKKGSPSWSIGSPTSEAPSSAEATLPPLPASAARTEVLVRPQGPSSVSAPSATSAPADAAAHPRRSVDPTPAAAPPPEVRSPRPPPRPSYTPLVASAGGFAGLLVGVALLLAVLLVLVLRG